MYRKSLDPAVLLLPTLPYSLSDPPSKADQSQTLMEAIQEVVTSVAGEISDHQRIARQDSNADIQVRVAKLQVTTFHIGQRILSEFKFGQH